MLSKDIMGLDTSKPIHTVEEGRAFLHAISSLPCPADVDPAEYKAAAEKLDGFVEEAIEKDAYSFVAYAERTRKGIALMQKLGTFIEQEGVGDE